MVGGAALRALRRREGGNVPAAAAALLSRRGVPGGRASPANTAFLSATSPRKGLVRMLCSGGGGGGGGAGAGEKNTGARVVQQALRHREGGNVPAAAAAAALLTRRGVPMPGGQAPPATIAFLSSTSPSPRNGVARRLCSGRDAAGAGAGEQNTGACVVQPGAGGSAGGCKCAQEISRLRADSMAETQKLWNFNSSLIQQSNDMAKDLTDIQIKAGTNNVEITSRVTELGYTVMFAGISAIFAVVSFMVPSIKQEWQHETVEVVMTQLEKKKAGEKEPSTVDVKAALDKAPPKKL